MSNNLLQAKIMQSCLKSRTHSEEKGDKMVNKDSACVPSASKAHVWSHAEEIEIEGKKYSKITCIACKKVDMFILS
jgi:hypothetical protein